MDNIKLSKLKFYNLASIVISNSNYNIDNIDNIIFKQYNKIREEFYEFCVEFNKIASEDFILELLDLIQASITMYHIIYGDDMNINKKLLQKLTNRIKQGEFDI